MAEHKVPQDVESEDKLIGPLSFRQFIYFLLAGLSAFIGFLLFRIAPFLVILPIPLAVFFGVLALPLRKDQPMEVYLLAVIHFLMKPRLRPWIPDGSEPPVEIIAPKIESNEPASLSPEAAEQRLDYLSRIIDSRGWSLKGIDNQQANLAPAVVTEAANATDIMDAQNDLAKSFDDLLAKKDQERRAAAVETMQQAKQAPAPQSALGSLPNTSVLARQFATMDQGQPTVAPHFNPYPTSMHQRVIQPFDANDQPVAQPAASKPQPAAPSPMTAQVPPAIMRLANNNDLSISAIAREAHRLQEGDEGEVVITLH